MTLLSSRPLAPRPSHITHLRFLFARLSFGHFILRNDATDPLPVFTRWQSLLGIYLDFIFQENSIVSLCFQYS